MKIKFSILLSSLFLIPALAFAQDATILLGGMVKSDRWIIRKDKMEEEFIGNVSYANDVYTVKSDYALSRRKQQTFTLKGNVYAAQKQKDTKAELTANSFFYDKKNDKGYALPARNNQVSAVYTTYANRFKAFADRIDFKDKFSDYTLSGNGELQDINNTLYAQTMLFNTQTGIFNAEGGRPVLWGFSQNGDYAMQADSITAQTQQGIYKAQGRVQGWVVSAREFPNLTQGSNNGTEIL